jgi:hypothetical protein
MSTKTASIKSFVNVDTKYNHTFDLPKLRYYGSGIPIFLWDNNQDYPDINAVLGAIDMSLNYESKYFNALTANKYVPWYNMDDSKDSYAAYCLEEYEDIAFLDVPEYTMATPKPIKGKVCLVSLEALQELDIFYENERLFTRSSIQVYPSQYCKKPMEAFTWFNNVDQISSFDEDVNEHVLDANIDPTPFRDSNVGGVEYYEM